MQLCKTKQTCSAMFFVEICWYRYSVIQVMVKLGTSVTAMGFPAVVLDDASPLQWKYNKEILEKKNKDKKKLKQRRSGEHT